MIFKVWVISVINTDILEDIKIYITFIPYEIVKIK